MAHTFASESWARGVEIREYVHYRLVLGTVGYPLRRFRGTSELLHATYDAFEGELIALL